MIDPEEYQRILELVPIVCVDIAVVKDGLLLLIKREQEPAKGEWWLPGGRLFKGESLRECAIRKAREEIGLEVPHVIGSILRHETWFETGPWDIPTHSINFVWLLKIENWEKFEPKSDNTWQEHQWVDNNFSKREGLHPYIIAALVEVFYLT